MVKLFLSFVLLFTLTSASALQNTQDDLLTLKIKQLLDESVYKKNSSYIKTIFAKKERYYKQERVDVMSVVGTLKENGLLKLSFKEPQELTLSFKTLGQKMFFVKIMSDTLRNIGYYRYVTTNSALDNSEFSWTIGLQTEYATDPLVLEKELRKSSCKIVDIKRVSDTQWEYTIDMSNASLNVTQVSNATDLSLKRSLYAHWLNVASVNKIYIESGERNNWYPHIVYYDSSLHILKLVQEDKKVTKQIFEIPKDATYMKISDIYTMKNLKDDLLLHPSGNR